MSSSPRIGLDDDGTLDEFFAADVQSVHFEDMGDGDWWLAVQLYNGQLWHLNFGTRNARAKTYARVEQVS